MKTRYRSVWLSDIHLCTRDCQAQMIYSFLSSMKCEYLYLVGDIIDLVAMRQRCYWPPIYNEILHKLLKRSRKGTRVVFVPGNHDAFFRAYTRLCFGLVEILEDVSHTMLDGRRFLVLHGDAFDPAVRISSWSQFIGWYGYDYLILANRRINAIRQWLGKPYWSLAGAIKRRLSGAVRHLTDFEHRLVAEAQQREYDGVICGHTHQPVVRTIDGITYANTGDWVENCTALVETEAGELELIWWHGELDERCRDMPEQVALPHHVMPRSRELVVAALPFLNESLVDDDESALTP